MYRSLTASLIALGALLAGAPAAGAGGPVDLTIRPVTGERAVFSFESSQVIRTLGQGQGTGTNTAEVSFDIAITPKAVVGATTTYDLQLIRYAYTNDQDGVFTQFNSAKPPTEDAQRALLAQFAEVRGTILTARVDASGKVTSVTGGALLTRNPLGSRLAGEIFTREGVQRRMGPIFSTRAPNPASVEVGASWTSEDRIPMGAAGDIIAKNTHRLAEVQEGVAVIRIESPLQLPPPETRAGVKITPVEGQTSGVQRWDTQRGGLESFEGRQRMILEVEGPSTQLRRTVEVRQTISRQPPERPAP